MAIKKLKSQELNKLGILNQSSTLKHPKKLYSGEDDTPEKRKTNSTSGVTTIVNKWANYDHKNSRIRRLVFFDSESSLNDLHTIPKNNSESVIRLEHKSSQYILRKATLDVARAILNVYPKVRSHVEQVVGYLMTLSGKVYLMTKAVLTFFSFDSELSHGCSLYKNPKTLKESSKIAILEKAIEHIVALSKMNLLLRDLSIKNVFFSQDEVFLGDLRSLRMSVNPKSIIDSIKTFLRQLLSAGLITKEEVTYLLAYYMGGNTNVCLSWFKQEYSREGEELEVLEKLESEIIKPQFA